VKLVTTTIRTAGNASGMGRAEALRRAMLGIIDQAEPQDSHPAYWAPFIV